MRQQRDGLGRLFRRRPVEDLPQPVVVHHPRLADPGGTPRLAPGTFAQRRSRHQPDAVGRDLGPLGRRDLGGFAQSLGHRQEGGKRDLHFLPSVIVLEGQGQDLTFDAHFTDARGKGQSGQLRDLGPDLAGVPIERVATDQDEVEPTLALEGRGQGARRGQGVRAAERRIAQVDAPVRPPGDRFTQDVLRRRRTQREDGARPTALPGPFDPLGDGPPAVGVHFELDPVADEPPVLPQRHRLPHRNLLHKGGDPQGPIELAFGDVVSGHGRHDTRHQFGIGEGPNTPRPFAYTLGRASSSTAEQRTLNPQVSGSNPEGRTRKDQFRAANESQS